ncbi:ferredoxin [Streptomyces coelicoflavus]|uniref:ferredoxin n=1 Tax=Streptomyces coelicoflavus TaxID=285562 RepID=UPI0038154256
MRVDVEQDKCVAAGQCVLLAPEVFDQRDEDGIVELLDARPTPGAREGVREAAEVCPAAAIQLVEG